MTTERLEEFRVLARVLNYSKAAEKLFLSQSILSRHIQELENELGVPLFFRDTHSVRLTDEGNFLLRWAEPLLERTDRAIAALTEDRGESDACVQILYAEQTLNTTVLSFIRSFIERHPQIRLQLRPVHGQAKRDLLYTADIGLAPVDYTDMIIKDVDGSLLCSQEALLAIPPYSALGIRQEISLSELGEDPLIVPYVDDLFGPYARNALLATRKCRSTLRRIEAGSPEEALLKVELGEGVALIPHHLKHRVYPHTRTIPVSDADCRFPIFLYLNKANHNPAAEFFYEKMGAAFRT